MLRNDKCFGGTAQNRRGPAVGRRYRYPDTVSSKKNISGGREIRVFEFVLFG